jgi:hypothetical protein
MTQAVNLAALGSAGVSTGFKNRVINGDFRVDQRNGGNSIAITTYAQYPADRWQSWHFLGSGFYSMQRKSDGSPVGNCYLRVTTTSVPSLTSGQASNFRYVFEGNTIADLGWGTATAQPATLSFWVRSSITGTWTASIRSVVVTANYNFQYTISQANTWQKVIIPIAPPTSQGASAFPTTTAAGLDLTMTLGGVGSLSSVTQNAWTTDGFLTTSQSNMFATNGSTYDITGVQFEVGSTASNFEFRDIGTELRLCQRYYQKLLTSNQIFIYRPTGASTSVYIPFKVSMRAVPSFTLTRNSTLYGSVNTSAGTSGIDVGNATAEGTEFYVYTTAVPDSVGAVCTAVATSEI